ncbi:MAG: RNA ligase family protein [Candidatus Pacebacteria bacterium]|nr:RNA ligase family protein [Candidatus Paceibacterota bacterium]
MSELIVEVCEVLEVLPHGNADRLEIVTVKNWPVVVQKGLLKQGDPVVFFPPDSVLTEELADRLGIRKYLAPVKTGESVTGYRVRATRLRGVASFGTIDHEIPEGFAVGADVAEHYGVTKWEPPARGGDNWAGGGLKGSQYRVTNAAFHRYKSISNIRHNRNAFKDGEMVVLTEKVHGSNMRSGLIKTPYDPGTGFIGFLRRIYCRVFGSPEPTYELMAGSHNLPRDVYSEDGSLTEYALPIGEPNVVGLLKYLSNGEHDVILFSELFGSGVQDMTYGHKDGSRGFLAFDITIDGRYLDAVEKYDLLSRYQVPTVPVLYTGPFSWDVVEAYTDGPTTICDPKDAGPFKGREGVVVTCLTEPRDYPGRKIYKSISADYLARKNATDSH